MRLMAIFMSALLLSAAASTLGSLARASEEPYPARVVRIEDLKLESSRTPLKLPRHVTERSKDVRTIIAVGHVNKNGAVVRSKLEQSSGVEQFDRTAVRWMRTLRFAPYLVDGEPAEVSLVLPMHIPADDALR